MSPSEGGAPHSLLASRDQIEAGLEIVREVLAPTPQIEWPLLSARAGCRVFVKHENHLPTGAFKVRGGLVLTATLEPGAGIVSATRGNHGQSLAFAAARRGLSCTIVVPHGNSVEKNAAMRAYGAELIEHGRDFDEARPHARALAEERGLTFVPSLHPLLVRGVASYGYELFGALPELDAVYVPIGLGSGVLGVISAREALAARAEVIGVVAEGADAYARSFEAGHVVTTERAETIADGMAVRGPDAQAVELMRRHVARIVRVSEDELRAAMRHCYTDTHQLAEGAGAAPLAALLQERDRMSGKRVAVVQTGGNVDRALFARILAEE